MIHRWTGIFRPFSSAVLRLGWSWGSWQGHIFFICLCRTSVWTWFSVCWVLKRDWSWRHKTVMTVTLSLASLLLSAERSFTGTSDITETPIGINGLLVDSPLYTWVCGNEALMFPKMFKPGEICNFNSGNVAFNFSVTSDDMSESKKGNQWTQLNVTWIKL